MNCSGCTPQCCGMKTIVLGLLILANMYWLNWDWAMFIAVLLIVVGALMYAFPKCPCSKGDAAPKGKKK